jgi:hypothetical protein
MERGQGSNQPEGVKGFQRSSNDGQTLSPYARVLEESGVTSQDASRWLSPLVHYEVAGDFAQGVRAGVSWKVAP